MKKGACQIGCETERTFRARRVRFSVALVAVVLSVALAVGSVPTSTAAWADQLGDAQTALGEAEARMKDIAEEYATLQDEADELQARIDATAQQALEAQAAVIKGREALGKSAVYEYRGGSTSLVLDLILNASSFDDLLRNLSYLESIMQYQADAVAAQKERIDRFNTLLSQLHVQKSDHDAKLAELARKQEEAKQVVDTARAHLSDAQAEEAARLAALEEERARLAARDQAEAGATVDENADTVNRQEPVPETTPVAPDPNPNPPSDDVTGWSSGAASAYGGATDPYVSNPCSTATGDICDDNSMGVAIPMSWPNYRSYFGRTVEISYSGMTVLATVNDCGGLLGGKRALDLQPGVWKAFGFSSCNAWGVRTVSYRFL